MRGAGWSGRLIENTRMNATSIRLQKIQILREEDPLGTHLPKLKKAIGLRA
jgi:hypothetical protein